MKKLLSAALAVCIMLSMPKAPPAAYASEPDSMEYTLLTALEIYNGSEAAKADTDLTRLDYAKILYAFCNADESDKTISFTDVAVGDAAYVNYVTSLGYIEGGQNGLFNADSPVKTSDVLKSLVIVLGYDEMAKVEGGYTKAARRLGLTKGVGAGENISYGLLAKILYNALLTSPALTYINGSGRLRAESEQDSYLYKTFDSVIISGRLTRIPQTGLYDYSGCRQNSIEINDEEYFSELDLKDFIGCNAQFLVRNTNGQDAVVSVLEYEKNNTVIEVSSEDIESFSENNYIYTDEKGKKRTARLETVRSIIRNGEALSIYKDADLLPSNGKIRLIDSDKNGLYDTAVIWDYTTVITGRYDADAEILYDKFGTASFDFSDTEHLNITQDGATVSEGALAKGSVCSVAQSKSGRCAAVLVEVNQIDSEIKSLEYEDGELSRIEIKEGTFDIDKAYFERNTDKKCLRPGAVVTAYADSFGRIVYIKTYSEKAIFGYLIDAKFEKGISRRLLLKIYTQDDEIKTYRAADKVRIDGEKSDADNVFETLKKGTDSVMPQLIQFKLNDEKEIVMIDTPYNNEPYSSNELNYKKRRPAGAESDESLRMIYASSMEKNPDILQYKTAGYTFGRWPVVTGKPNTMVFVVPSNPKEAEENYFGKYDMNYFDYDHEYYIDAYSFGESSMSADIIVYIEDTVSSGIITQFNNVAMIESIKYVKETPGGEEGVCLTVGGYNNVASSKIYCVDEDKYLKVKAWQNKKDKNEYALSKGDIIIYDVDSQKIVTTIFMIFDASEKDASKAFKADSVNSRIYGDITSYPRIAYVDVYKIADGCAACTVKDLTAYEGDMEDLDFVIERLDFFDESSTHYYNSSTEEVHLNQLNNYVYSYEDVKDYKSYGDGYSRIITVLKWGWPLSLFIIDR